MRQHGVLLTLVLSPKPHPECEQIAADHNSRSTILVMDDASGQSCMMLSGAHRSDSVVHDRGQKLFVRSKHPHVQLNRFVSKYHGIAHT